MFFSVIWFLTICITFFFKGFVLNTKNSKMLFIIRRFNECAIFFVPGIFYNQKLFEGHFNSCILVIGLAVPFIYWFCNKKLLMLMLMEESYPDYEKIPVYKYIVNIITLVVMPIGEEVFFRGIMLDDLKTINIYLGIIVNSILFSLLHYIQRRGNSNKKEILNQICFSAFFSILVLYGGGVGYSIVSHIIYNFPFLMRIVNITKMRIKK